MESLRDTIKKFGKFEVFYMLVMIIYMGQATSETSRMVGSLSGNPIPFLLPIVLTYILCRRHPISFNNKKLLTVLLIYFVWTCLSIIKYGDFSTQSLSYYFFIAYAILIAYIHNQIFGYKFLSIYENVMVFICKIAIIGWLVAMLLPVSASLYRLFPETLFGNHVLYLFNWMDPVKGQIYSGLLRNAGCSWEPGRFAIMVTLAIFCNICQKGIKFKANKNIWWLIVALLTTQSTTGMSVVLIIYLFAIAQNFSPKKMIVVVFIMLPLIAGIMQLDFMSDKIEDRLEINSANDRFYESESYYSRSGADLERHVSLDRFQSMYFEWMNFTEDIFLGYSRDVSKSWFGRTFISDYSLTGGLVKVLSQYGLILGLIIYFWLYKSSLIISRNFKAHMPLALFLSMIFASISYPIWGIPVFTTFWMYGFFGQENKSTSKI